jgi:dihydroorotase
MIEPKQHHSIFLRGGRLLDPASGLDAMGDLLIADGRIISIMPTPSHATPPPDAKIIECHGLCLAPGLVDMRAHVGEPGLEHKETLATALAAAAAGGVSTVAALPDGDSVIDDVPGVEFLLKRSQGLGARLFPYACISRAAKGEALAEMGLLAEAGAIGFTDGPFPIGDSALMRRALLYARSFGKTLFQHPCDRQLSSGVMNAGAAATRLGLAGIPPMAETIGLERDLRLVEMTGAPYHQSLDRRGCCGDTSCQGARPARHL